MVSINCVPSRNFNWFNVWSQVRWEPHFHFHFKIDLFRCNVLFVEIVVPILFDRKIKRCNQAKNFHQASLRKLLFAYLLLPFTSNMSAEKFVFDASKSFFFCTIKSNKRTINENGKNECGSGENFEALFFLLLHFVCKCVHTASKYLTMKCRKFASPIFSFLGIFFFTGRFVDGFFLLFLISLLKLHNFGFQLPVEQDRSMREFIMYSVVSGLWNW